MRTHEHLSSFRNRVHPQYGSDDDAGMCGFFVIPLCKASKTYALVISNHSFPEMPWEHVSVRIGVGGGGKKKMVERTPTWDEMCAIKKLFWRDDEVVMQLHPAEAEYVNTHPHVLHLWKPTHLEIPMPPMSAV